MNLLTLKKRNKRYDLQINNIKYCIGNDFEEKYNFVNILKEVFLLSKESEYSINNSGQAQVLINDKEIKVKEISFYQINHHYSITNDLKLTAHSLIARYLEILIAQDDNLDTINTINLLLESFTNELDNELNQFDIIINTIPHIILNKEKLKLLKRDCLIIDIASNPGGVDRKAVKEIGIKLIWALSLPGRVAPITSAEFIKETLENILKDIKNN